jgi:hypothetical protein
MRTNRTDPTRAPLTRIFPRIHDSSVSDECRSL